MFRLQNLPRSVMFLTRIRAFLAASRVTQKPGNSSEIVPTIAKLNKMPLKPARKDKDTFS